MKHLRVIGSIALAVAVASVAQAQDAYANAGYGWYVSWSGNASAYGAPINSYSYDYQQGTGVNYTSYSSGSSEASVPYGYAVQDSESYGALTLSNYAGYAITESVTVYTAGGGFTYAGTSGIAAYDAGAYAYDSSGQIDQEAYGEGEIDNLGWNNYEHYGYSDYYTTGTVASLTNYNPDGLTSYGPYQGKFWDYSGPYGYALTATYTITIGANSSDTIYIGGSQDTGAAASTPGPVAVAPFVVGLLGAIRRRSKK